MIYVNNICRPDCSADYLALLRGIYLNPYEHITSNRNSKLISNYYK
ncbi:30014_t:CDS:1, partial [Gigaspora margarita]